MSMRRIGADYRNGHYVRHLLTEMGDLELLVPRSRKGKFPTKLFERYARRCRFVDKVLLACFCLGLSHPQSCRRYWLRFWERRSRLRRFHASHGIWTTRSVAITIVRSRINTRYLFFDGVVLKSKGAVKVQKKILLCAFGITVEGRHEMIDFYPAASESEACWGDLPQMTSIRRGLKGNRCELIATDGGTGLHARLTDRLSKDRVTALLGA